MCSDAQALYLFPFQSRQTGLSRQSLYYLTLLLKTIAPAFTHYPCNTGVDCTSRRDGEDAERQMETRQEVF